MHYLWRDLRHGARLLIKNPSFTAIAVLTLALGIGANTAIFSVVNGVLLRPLPYPEQERLVMIWEDPGNIPRNNVNPRNYADWREQNQVFEQVAAFYLQSVNLTDEGEPERMIGARVAANFFSILRVNAAHGRTFLPAEDRLGSQPVAVISHSLWQRRFGGDPNVIGRTLALNGTNTTVVGVMPSDFGFPQQAELWTPLVFTANELANTSRGSHYLNVVGRLKPGVSVEQAKAEMESIYDRLRQEYPQALAKWKVHVISMSEDIVGNVRSALLILLGAVYFVLLIACANVANLMLARATVRQKEIAIRAALGASRFRLIQQLLTESFLLALAGGGLGVLLGLWGIDLLVRLNPGDLPRLDEITLDRNVFLFALLLSLLSGLIFGVTPALQSSGINLNESLKDAAGRVGAGRRQSSLRQSFVVVQVALSLVLLVGAGLMIRSFIKLGKVELGFNPENLLTMRVSLPASRYAEWEQQISFYRQVVERIKVLPGIESAALISDPPISNSIGLWQNGFRIEGRPDPPPGHGQYAYLRWTSPDYFQTLAIPLLKGRLLTDSDTAERPGIVVIDAAMAREFFPDEDPIGKRILIGIRDRGPREIVGIVGNVRQTSLDYQAGPHMYIPYYQTPLSYATLLVRTFADPTVAAAAVKQEVLAVDPRQPIYSIRTMNQIISNSLAGRRFNLTMLGIFAGVALLLAAIGIYGVMNYVVTERTRELGVRLALGAQARDILKLVFGQAMWLILAGVAIGLGGSLVLTRLMKKLLFEVEANDPVTFMLVTSMLGLVALLACWIPARRASKVDPMIALRSE
jgi:putative ABC transport system permease protein